MNLAQVSAFTRATGGITASQMVLAVAGILAVVYLLWLAWIALSQYRSWQNGQGDFYDVMFVTTRGVVVALLLGYLIR